MSHAANAMPFSEVTQRHIAPPSRHIFPTQVYYTGYDQVHHAYLVLVPDAVPKIESCANPGPSDSTINSDTDVPRTDASGNIGNASDNSARKAHVKEPQVDDLDSSEDKKGKCELSGNPVRGITEGTDVANPEFRLSVVIPEEGGEFVWL